MEILPNTGGDAKNLEKDNVELDKQNTESIEELDGSLDMQDLDDKLMHSVMENDKEKIDEGKLIQESLNNGSGGFTPDMMFEQMVTDYKTAKQIFGESLIRQLSGYDPEYVERNINIPEFQREMKKQIEEKISNLKKDKLIDKDGIITNKGVELASVVLYVQELDNLVPKGMFGKRVHKKRDQYGDPYDSVKFKKGDRYSNIDIKRSINTAVRRGHKDLNVDDLRSYERKSKGECSIIYALDASGSMKGNKVGTCKRAGVSLAFNAINQKDKVGLMVFGAEVRTSVAPTDDFSKLLKAFTSIKAEADTDIAQCIRESITLFPSGDQTKHLLLLTDALATKGEGDPEQEALEMVGVAKNAGITVSVIGIDLDVKGREFAQKMTAIGKGKLYVVNDLENLGKIVLQDYYSIY